jgi:hypothetical protein
MLKRFVYSLIGIVLIATAAWATVDRAAPLTGDLDAVIADINEELDFIYDRLPQPLESVSGTNTYTASITGIGALTGYTDGNRFRAKIPNSNTSTTITLNIDNVGAISVVDKNGSAIPVGGLAANSAYTFEYFGGADNHFRVMSPLTTTGTPGHNFCVAASDETTTITTGTAKVTFNMPQAMALTGVFAYLRTAATGLVTIDINEDTDAEGAGASATIMAATKLTIDANERRSSTAATAPVLSDTALAQHSEITIDIDAIVSGSPNGLKVCFVGTFS